MNKYFRQAPVFKSIIIPPPSPPLSLCFLKNEAAAAYAARRILVEKTFRLGENRWK
jgi:hypothetical protein